MCGLVGLLSPDSIDGRVVRKGLDVLGHRGPDGSGSWAGKDGRMALGHARLSVIGLDNGHQPLVNAEGDVHAVVNGELYGYRQIRDRLRAEGCMFQTESDSEVALHLYQRHGMRMTEWLRGEYAIVIADERRQRMVAIRDRFGIKPLYYACVQGRVYFASEVKALLAMGVPARWDTESAYLDAYIFRSHERTLFAGIRSVPQGCYAIAQDGEVRVYPYWDWHFPTKQAMADDDRSEAEVVTGFREVLDDAVRQRLVADVEVGCYLSGGIDSSAVLGLAQRHLDRPVRAFTLAFDDPTWDESDIARRQAAHVGATYHEVPVTRRALADAYGDAVWHAETPILNGHGPAKYLLSKAVRDAGLKVVFTGEGADEVLGGYAPFRRDALLHHGQGRSAEDTQALLDRMFASNPATRSVFLTQAPDNPSFHDVRGRLGWLPSFIEAYTAMGIAKTPFYRAEVQQAWSRRPVLSSSLDRLPLSQSISDRDRLHQALYINSKHHLPNYVLTVLGDRMEMAHSIEGRVPFLDTRVADYAAGVPIALKVNGHREKHVLREACKDVLIDEVYNREKHPFATPPTQPANDPMMTFFEDILASKALDEQPVFDPMGARMALGFLKACDAERRPAVEAAVQRIVSTVIMHQRFQMA